MTTTNERCEALLRRIAVCEAREERIAAPRNMWRELNLLPIRNRQNELLKEIRQCFDGLTADELEGVLKDYLATAR